MTSEFSAPDSFSADMEALQPLFDVTSLETFKVYRTLFSAILDKEAEFSFAPFKNPLEITIEGRGADFHESIMKWLSQLGIPQEQQQAYAQINGSFPDTGTLLKTDFCGGKKPSVSIYYQTQVSARLAHHFARLLGLPDFSSDTFLSIGKLLDRKGLFIGIDLAQGCDPALAVFYLIPPRKAGTGLIDRLVEVQKLLGMDEAQHDIIRRFHGTLTSLIVGDLFVSFLAGRELHPLMKIDYDKTTAPLVVRIVKELGLDEEEIRRFARVAKTFDTRVLNYFGMKYQRGRNLTYKFYFKRSYGTLEGNDTEKFARFLESTIWRFN